MEKYINKIPLVLRNAIKGLSDEKRQSILIYLLREGSKSFTEINDELKISKNNLSHHLKVLMQYGLLYNFYDRNELVNKYSFYEVRVCSKITSLP
ncbi:MAG: ArsR/SmtB family transcription factor [Promethearchaeota archaeon]